MKKVKNFIFIIFFLYIILQIFLNNQLVHDSIFFGYNLFIYNVLPNLFPFLVISNLLINYGFVEICYKVFNKIMTKMFRISGNGAFIFIMSLLTGFPSNAKYTKELYENNKIDEVEGSKILMFTHFSNPLFIIGTISTFINKKVALTILLCHYLGNIIIGLIFRNSFITKKNNNITKIAKENFGIVFSKSIISTINTLLLIFGTMISFLIISTIVKNNLHLNAFSNALISGILEMTQGLKYVSLLNINYKIKAILMTIFISFGGISVHTQVLSIISDTKIKYQPFLIARLLHASISSLLVYFIT